MKTVEQMTNAELADCITSAKLAPSKYLELKDLRVHEKAIVEAARRLRAKKNRRQDKECACHHDGSHDRLLPCPMPNCGAPARIYRDRSGYYVVECTKCGHSMIDGHEVTEYWAARRWNAEIKKMKEKTDE